MKAFHYLNIAPIAPKDARRLVVENHYMKTYPSGARLNLGIFDIESGRAVGVMVFGYSTATESKVLKYCSNLKKTDYLEMQRLWISDVYGANSESYILAKAIKILKNHYKMKVIVTHSGGCKNDCGIVYQASGWLYFGREVCRDFYLTESGEYKNIIAAMRFGRVSVKGKTRDEIGAELFGPGEIIDSYRYLYLYPIDRGIRRRLQKQAQPYPKTSKQFRRNQAWVKPQQGDGSGERIEKFLGSSPSISTK